MSHGRESPRFWWGQTSVNTDTFFSEAAHPQLMHDDCGVDAERWTVRKGVTLIRDATADSRELERLGHCGVFPGRP